MTCGNIDFKSLQANFGQSKTWQKQFFAYLHCAAEGKSLTLTFGDPEEQSTSNATETPAEEPTTEEVPTAETSATEETAAE
jgi:C4-type Zn-finger protein